MTDAEFKAHRKSLPPIEQAKWWYWEKGITAYIFNSELFITVGKYDIQVHPDEVRYRAHLYSNDITS